jgi:[ribosomal protein S18]-alanine N-acetyltransferase
MIVIRRMELKDIPEVVEIDRSSFSLPWTERSFKYEVQENRAARCWVTVEDDRIVAMMVLWIIVDEAHVATIATHPHFRRRGFARKMLVKSLVLAREEGTLKALLEVRAHHAVAQKIYCDIGFVEVGRRPMYYRDNGEDAVLMTMENLDALTYAEGE